MVIRISGYLSQTTVKLISKTKSQWDKKKWDYFAFHSKRDYDRYTACRYVVVIQRYNKHYTFSLNEIKDYTPLKTPDGNYFIAHEPVSKIKKESKMVREQFLELGINYFSHGFFDYKLNSKNSQIMKGMFS